MPERDNTHPAVISYTQGSYSFDQSWPGMIGVFKSIDPLNHGDRPKSGEYRCNPVTIFEATGFSSSISANCQDAWYGPEKLEGDVGAIFASTQGLVPGAAPPVGDWSSQQEQYAINKAYAKLMRADLDVGVMIGELGETIRGLINPFSSLKRFLQKYPLPSNFMRGGIYRSRETAVDLADMLSGSWLEWRFGIRPLLKDIQDIYEHVNSQKREFDDKMHRRGGRTPKAEVVSSKEEGFDSTGFRFKCQLRTKRTDWYTAAVVFRATAPLTWQERYGLDLLNLPGIAWELVPLSFIVDRFLSINTWLEALKTVSSKIEVFGVSVTRRVDLEAEVKVREASMPSYDLPATVTDGTYTYTCRYMCRKCFPPGFNTLTPALNPKSQNLQQIIDDLTLTWQRLPKLKR